MQPTDIRKVLPADKSTVPSGRILWQNPNVPFKDEHEYGSSLATYALALSRAYRSCIVKTSNQWFQCAKDSAGPGNWPPQHIFNQTFSVSLRFASFRSFSPDYAQKKSRSREQPERNTTKLCPNAPDFDTSEIYLDFCSTRTSKQRRRGSAFRAALPDPTVSHPTRFFAKKERTN